MSIRTESERESRQAAMEATFRLLIRREALASAALDGDTIALTRSADRRETPGFGCPCCGAPLGDATRRELITALRCCGHVLDGPAAARLLLAARQDPDRPVVEHAA